jgi:hypothetical protein
MPPGRWRGRGRVLVVCGLSSGGGCERDEGVDVGHLCGLCLDEDAEQGEQRVRHLDESEPASLTACRLAAHVP